MKKLLVTLCLILCTFYTINAIEIKSGSGKIKIFTDVNNLGEPEYSLILNEDTIINHAHIGLITDFADLSSNLKIVDFEIDTINFHYTQDKIKKRDVKVEAVKATINYTDSLERRLTSEWHVADDGVAFRLIVPRQLGKGSMRVMEEKNTFKFPCGTNTFLTSQAEPMTGWKRTKPSYEEYYLVDRPMGEPSEFGYGYTFPALFKTPENNWILLTETGVDGYYCGSHLSDFNCGFYSIAFPMEDENNGNGSKYPGVALPGFTPWRVMIVGENLSTIVESTLPWDLVEPLYKTHQAAKPGKGTWSWILWQDGSINFEDQIRYIDLASELGYQNVLVDNWWDKTIGKDGIEVLKKYADSKGVSLILWFSSSGYWNDIEQGPINLMDRPIPRKETMKWLQDIGIETIKVDFFGGDKQETIRLYEDILSDAADHDLQVIFHGCTLPRGWERMYPNFVGAEAVLASENMIFDQNFCDREAQLATLHPYIRNSVAIMEYGGTFLNKRMSKGNDSGNYRRTSDGFQLATAVLFQNPVQNFALAPNNLSDASEIALEFMKIVPTTWDDTKYIDGYPGRFVVIARKNNDKWYIAGISNLEEDKDLELKLPMFKAGQEIEIIYDDTEGNLQKEKKTIDNPEKVEVSLKPLNGFIITGELVKE